MSESLEKIRVLLADDNSGMLCAVRRLLEREFRIVGEVSDGLDLLRAARKLAPQVMVVDISMPSMTGLEAVRQLSKEHLPSRAVFLTIHDDPILVEEALACGAFGFVSKAAADRDLLDAVRAAAAGERFVSAGCYGS